MGTAHRAPARTAQSKPPSGHGVPLLEAGAIDGAKGILINISGSSILKLSEVQRGSTIIQNAAHEDANIIFGAVLDEKMKDGVKITVIATGFARSRRGALAPWINGCLVRAVHDEAMEFPGQLNDGAHARSAKAHHVGTGD